MPHVFYRTAETHGHDFLEVDAFAVWTKKPIRGARRRKRFRETREAQKIYNAKRAARYFIRLIHANFTSQDYSITLTYDDMHLPEDDEQVKKDMRNFISKLRRLYKKHTSELKYVLSSAHGKRGGRAHHHLIVSGGVPIDDILDLWKFGRARCEKLQFDVDGVAALADYMLQQSEVWSKRWCCSRNLIRPEPGIRDDRINAREAYTIADVKTSPAKLYEMVAQIWPGYQLASIQSQNLNEVNGGAYFTLRLVKSTSKYAAPDFEYWSTAWLKRKQADGRDHIKVRDGRSIRRYSA